MTSSWKPVRLWVGLAIVAVTSGTVFAQQPLTAPLAEVRVYPPSIDFSSAKDVQTLVVQGVQVDGLTRDLTALADYKIENPALLKRTGSSLWPVADGETKLNVSFGGKSQSIPVKVAGSNVHPPLSFRLDVMPIFMKANCNTGSCHGAARGKDGFRLSLFGFDEAGDHFRITREMSGRRVDLAMPAASLLVEKSIGAVPHTGGKRFELTSALGKTLTQWIADGCPDDAANVPTVTDMQIYPTQAVLDGEGETQQVTVVATYSDGSSRDVTSLALFQSNNDNSASIDEKGLVKAGSRGEAFVMARFNTKTVGAQFIVLPKGLKFNSQKQKDVNYIDTLVNAKLNKLRIPNSPVCTDEVFLRRIYLDLVGILPTTEEYEKFMSSNDPEKRNKVIDELLERKDFTEIWVAKWAEWLMMRSNNNRVSYKGVLLYYTWLAEQIGNNVPWDEMVKSMLGANGGTFKVAPTNYYQFETDTLKVAENTAQIFMGMRLQCAQCHNHPFDRWTQNDYYSFSAFFSQIGRKRGEDQRETIVYNSSAGEVRHPVNSKVMPPIYLGLVDKVADVAGKDRRVVLADWLASPQNPFFAQNFANRVWHHFFGIGIIEPVDDVRISNPATNPELLSKLGEKFVEYKYDLRKLVRDICRSNAYQRSTARVEGNETDELNFSHATVRRIKAESLLDSISQVTNTKDKFRGLPLGARAQQIADGVTTNYFLTTFGRASRETPCSCEVKMEPTLSQALHLINGDTVNAKIRQGAIIDTMLKQKMEPLEIAEKLYISALSRRPTEAELENFKGLFADPKLVKQGLEDIFWALLNSREFLFNH